MKPAEKLKRIKLISEQIFIQTSVAFYKDIYVNPETCIQDAVNFVNEFEKFETQFLKDNSEVVSE